MSSIEYIASALGAFFGLLIVGRILVALHHASVIRRDAFSTPWLTLAIDEDTQ